MTCKETQTHLEVALQAQAGNVIYADSPGFRPFERSVYQQHIFDLTGNLADLSVAHIENALLTVRVHSSKAGILPVAAKVP
jgi:hypothetical protein